jgi:hypothetical protein
MDHKNPKMSVRSRTPKIKQATAKFNLGYCAHGNQSHELRLPTVSVLPIDTITTPGLSVPTLGLFLMRAAHRARQGELKEAVN